MNTAIDADLLGYDTCIINDASKGFVKETDALIQKAIKNSKVKLASSQFLFENI